MLHDAESRLLIARERAELLRAEAARAALPPRPRPAFSWKRTADRLHLHLRPGYASAVSVSGSKK
jgi:hypothetical protein